MSFTNLKNAYDKNKNSDKKTLGFQADISTEAEALEGLGLELNVIGDATHITGDSKAFQKLEEYVAAGNVRSDYVSGLKRIAELGQLEANFVSVIIPGTEAHLAENAN